MYCGYSNKSSSKDSISNDSFVIAPSNNLMIESQIVKAATSPPVKIKSPIDTNSSTCLLTLSSIPS